MDHGQHQTLRIHCEYKVIRETEETGLLWNDWWSVISLRGYRVCGAYKMFEKMYFLLFTSKTKRARSLGQFQLPAADHPLLFFFLAEQAGEEDYSVRSCHLLGEFYKSGEVK